VVLKTQDHHRPDPPALLRARGERPKNEGMTAPPSAGKNFRRPM
jgi:hypothetical protein